MAKVAESLHRDAHTIGAWAADFCERGPNSLTLERSGDAPTLAAPQQAAFKLAKVRERNVSITRFCWRNA
jgi:hypothetical protein